MDKEIDWEGEGEGTLEDREKEWRKEIFEGAPDWLTIAYVMERHERIQEEIEVSEVGFFLGEDGRLGFYRVTRIKDFPFFIRCVNESISLLVAYSLRDFKTGEVKLPDSRAGTAEEAAEQVAVEEIAEEAAAVVALLMERVASRDPWITRHGDTLVLDIPVTEEGVAILLKYAYTSLEMGLAEGWTIPPGSDFGKEIDQLVSAISGVRIADGSVRLSFSPEGNMVQLHSDHRDLTANEELMEALAASPGLEELDRESLLQRYGCASAPPEPR